MSRKKFKIFVMSTGEEYKPPEGSMVVMNGSGVFFQVSGINDYYMGIKRLSDAIGNYEVIWKNEG